MLIVLLLYLSNILSASSTKWNWKCDSLIGTCTRLIPDTTTTETLFPSVETCRLVCGKYGGLWPHPTYSTSIGKTLIKFSLNSVKIQLPPDDNEVTNYLQKVSNLFLKSLSYDNSSSCENTENTVTISFAVTSTVTTLKWGTAEDYELQIQTIGNNCKIDIASNTIFGARHALETLTQLIEIYPEDNQRCLVVVDHVAISDFPTYTHRGLLLDTARNFLSIDSIKRQIDAMGYSKLNVLHWHITDSQSFPLEVPSLPNMTKYGAYSNDKIYEFSQISDVISYAKLRGVRVIIEIDAPSHAGNGWQWGSEAGLGNLAVCVNQEPWRWYCIQPPCGQLNPINPNVYKVLNQIYKDIMGLLPQGEIFHMGGDEVFIACWNSTSEIISYLGDKPRTTETFLDLWSEYQNKAQQAFDEAVGSTDTPIVLWTSHLTTTDVIEKYLPKDRYVIQTWVPSYDTLPQDLIDLGYKIIVSTKDAWYLDHGFWGSTVYHNWRAVYTNRIPVNSAVLGGEVCSWGEYVDDKSIDSRVWPRAAAAAERLWSNSNFTTDQVEGRFYRHRERLVARGIKAEAVTPRWCYQNERHC